MHKVGSSLLMMTLLISLTSIMIMIAGKLALYTVDFAIARSQEQIHSAQAEGVLNVGIGLANENFDALVAQGEKIILDLGPHKSKEIQSMLIIEPKQMQIDIESRIQKNGRTTSVACTIKKRFNKDDSSFLYIENWHHRAH